MSNRTRPSILMLLFHVFMTAITSGLWLIGLIIWHIMSSKKK